MLAQDPLDVDVRRQRGVVAEFLLLPILRLVEEVRRGPVLADQNQFGIDVAGRDRSGHDVIGLVVPVVEIGQPEVALRIVLERVVLPFLRQAQQRLPLLARVGGREAIRPPGLGAHEGPACDARFPALLQTACADEGVEFLARALVGAEMLDGRGRRGVVLLEACSADEFAGGLSLCLHAFGFQVPLNPSGEARERGQGLQSRLEVSQADLRLQKCDLLVDHGLSEIDVPGPRAAVASVGPAVAASFQGVLDIEGRLLRPDPNRLGAGRLEQKGQRGSARGRQSIRQNLEPGMAVINSTVSLVKEANAVQQVAELRTRKAVFAPVDLGRAACPGLMFEDGPIPLGELAVEPAVVCNDDHGIIDEGVRGRLVDPMAGHRVIGDAGKYRDLVGYRYGRLVEAPRKCP